MLRLIALRLVCAAAPSHVFEAVTAELECEWHTFTAKGKTVLENGWKDAESAFHATLRERPENSEEAVFLPDLAVGMEYRNVTASVREGQTKPPRRHTEGLLFYGNTTIPFIDRFPKGEIYNLLTTRLSEISDNLVY